MKTVSVVDAQKQLPGLVQALKEGPVVLLHRGRPCAALVGLDDRFDRESFSLGRDRTLRRQMDLVCRRTKKDGGIPFSEMLKEVSGQPSGRKKGTKQRRAKDVAAKNG
jgi:antitoxin (DNA-binding transcriptional repressor) of toxin-antitoxin stability system